MADIRINALATTAASTASDDFVAVDGTAQGTRKLSAYSPTFGGNLTASGTGAHTFGTTNTVSLGAGNITATNSTAGAGPTFLIRNLDNTNASSAAIMQATVGGANAGDPRILLTVDAVQDWTIGVDNSDSDKFKIGRSSSVGTNTSFTIDTADNTTLTGNLTVSGTGTSSVGGDFTSGAIIRSSGATNTIRIRGNAQYIEFTNLAESSYVNGTIIASTLNLFGNSGTGLSIGATGNSLFGTTTDSGNGRIQLATHTTSAGGIGFGTDVSLYRSNANTLVFQPTGSSKTVLFYGDATNSGLFNALSSYEAVYFDPSAHSVKLATNGTVALTLDTSQRCILAGALRLNNAYVSGAPTATGYVTIQDSAGNTYKVLVGT